MIHSTLYPKHNTTRICIILIFKLLHRAHKVSLNICSLKTCKISKINLPWKEWVHHQGGTCLSHRNSFGLPHWCKFANSDNTNHSSNTFVMLDMVSLYIYTKIFFDQSTKNCFFFYLWLFPIWTSVTDIPNWMIDFI